MAKLKVPVVPEKAIQSQIVRYLRLAGCTVYVLGTKRRKGDYPGTMQTPGLPDLWVFGRHGRWTWAEIKSAAGRLRLEQGGFLVLCVKHDVPHQVWRSVQDAAKWL